MKGTHAHRYAVYPNKGVLTPNSATTMQLFLNDDERQNFINLFEMLGQNGMDLDKDSLSIQYCTLLESDSVGLEAVGIDEDFWRGRTQESININIHHTIAEDTSSWPKVGRSGPFPSFPRTPAVRSCLHEINIRDDEKKCVHAFASFLGAIIIITVSLFWGAYALVPGTISLLKMLIERREWVNELESFHRNSVATEGRVVKRCRVVDKALGEEHYFVQFQYEAIDAGGSTQEYVVDFTSDVVTHNAKKLFELTEETSGVPMRVLPDFPKSAIPNFLLEDKLRVSRSYSRYWHPLRATLGILIYFGCSLIWFFIIPVQFFLCIILPVAAGGVAFAALMRLPTARKELELKQKLLQLEPTSIPTEKDAQQEFVNKLLGISPTRRGKLVMAVVGAFVSTVSCPPAGFFVLAFFGILPTISLVTTYRGREFKQDFEANKIVVSGKVCSHRIQTSSGQDNDKSYYGTIRYCMTVGDGIYTFEREFKSRELFNKVGCRVQVAVHPKHPRSGHPHAIVKSMAQKDKIWTKLVMLLSILLSICAYLFLHQVIYQSNVPEPLSSVVTSWVVTCIAPMLMVPQTIVWIEKDFRNDKKNLFNGANVVKFQGRRRLSAPQTIQIHSVTKAVEVSSNATLATGSASGESTIATSEFDYFDNVNRNSENERVVSLELV